MRTADELEASGLAVLDRAYYAGAYAMRPLFSGGHDSLCATWLAAQHRAFKGEVFHIDTGIGADYTREFVERVCAKYGWTLRVFKSKDTYEQQVIEHGFPGPGQHKTTYNRLKGRCVSKMTKGTRAWKNAAMLVSGARAQESVRRMGYVQPIVVGELIKSGPDAGKRRNKNRVWTAPCHDWSKVEQQHFMDEIGLPINKFKIAVGVSGECGCGSMASGPEELELWREHAPEHAAKVDALAAICRSTGKPCVWGQRPSGEVAHAETGPLCSACDQRAAASGLMITRS